MYPNLITNLFYNPTKNLYTMTYKCRTLKLFEYKISPIPSKAIPLLPTLSRIKKDLGQTVVNFPFTINPKGQLMN